MKPIPSWKLKKILTCDVTLHKISVQTTDDQFGQITSETEETYSIKAEIQLITLEDMAFLPAGSVSEGDAWGYFLSLYTIDGDDIEVEVNDYITFKGIKYLVQRIIDFYDGNTSVYRRAFLKREVGQ